MHTVLIKRFGGAVGVRDLGLLEIALYRPQTGYYSTLFDMAGALFEFLINNHPFIDGNKRVAFFATDVFLRMNGYKFVVDGKAAHQFLMQQFKTDSYEMANLLPWITDSVKPLRV